MKILVAGDTHGNYQHVRDVFAHACRVDADKIFQVGDCGVGFKFSQFKGRNGLVECWWLKKISDLVEESGVPWVFIPGNHDNYDYLDRVTADMEPEPDGTYQLHKGVFYVPRGTVLEWDGKRILCCGGAVSVDRFPRPAWDWKGRKEGENWWAGELITEADVQTCKAAGQANILFSHDFPIEVQEVDRHLDPGWGEWAQVHSLESRYKISGILANCGAKLVIHGHLHRCYSEWIEVNDQRVLVRGLERDSVFNRPTRISESTLLLDLETYEDELSSHTS